MKPTDCDVLTVGAGISGIGLARYLEKLRPGTRYAILEARDAIGGTWDLFRYPGIRSDSDLYTFGYEFKPWVHEKSIAGAGAILDYLAETARENGIDRHIRFRRKVTAAAWSSADGCWTVTVTHGDTGESSTLTTRWLFSAAGYYSYDQGYSPQFAGIERYRGRVVHPQDWPADLDCSGKRVVVIGSGATAVTLVPALAEQAAHVTQLQRTPSYVLPIPSEDRVARGLRRLLGDRLGYALARRKNILRQRMIWQFCRRWPQAARRLIRWLNARVLPEGYPVDVHFNPPYDPWDQRLCAVTDGDLFRAIRKGRASVVTDRIRSFTETGIELESGARLEADVVVTATGLNLQAFGGIPLTVDGRTVRLPDTVAFKGMMLSGVPNFAFAVGYTNSSWTLKVGLLCEHFCRLLDHMDEKGFSTCRPEVGDPAMPTRPLLDFGAGYVQRSMQDLPRQGPAYPWLMSMSYATDVRHLRNGPVEDPNLRFA